jgi:hypothetical protein
VLYPLSYEGRGRGMSKTWEKTCCGPSTILLIIDFSLWGRWSGRFLEAAGTLRGGGSASGRAFPASFGGEAGRLRR